MTWLPEPPSEDGGDDDVASLAARFLEDTRSRHPTAVGVRQARLQAKAKTTKGVRVVSGGRRRNRATGERQRRARERRRQKITRQGLFGTASLVVVGLVAAVALGLFVQRRIGGGDDTPAVVPPRPTQIATLISISDGRGIADVTVFALSPDETEGIVVLIPPGTRVEVPAAGLATLSEAWVTGGPGLLEGSVANMLGIRFDDHAVIPRDRLAAAFRRVSPILLEIPRRIAVTHPDGRIEVKFAAGPQQLTADQMVEYMTFRGDESDLDRVARQRIGWEAWFTAAGGRAGDDLVEAGALTGDQPVLRRVMGRVAELRRDVQILPVQSTSVGSTVEIFQPNLEEIRAMVDRVLAGAIPESAAAGRLKIDIRNGNGRIGVSQKVAGLLVPAGFQVVVTGNADHFRHETTDIVFYDEATEDAARDVVRILGVGRLVLNRFPSGVVDITVIVGKDFPEP